MVGTFLQMWTANRRDTFSRAIAGVCVALWIAGSVSTLYGSLTPQWTTPHCPQGQAHSGQQSHSHCAWHCDGIDAQAATGRNQGSSADPDGYMVNEDVLSLQTAAYRTGPAPRGPPATRLI